MDKIRDKYFIKSNDSSKFTISKYASRLSSKKALASHSINDACHPNPTSTPGKDWDGGGPWRVIKDLFTTTGSFFSLGLGGMARSVFNVETIGSRPQSHSCP